MLLGDMKYPAHRHYGDLDLSRPIPRIEARVDPQRVRVMRRITRVLAVVAAAYLALLVVFVALGTPIWLRISVMFVMVGVYVVSAWGLGVRRLRREHRDDPWGLPLDVQLRFYAGLYAFLLATQLTGIGSFGLAHSVGMAGMYVGGLGVGLAFVSLRFRAPGQISCEECGYPLVGLTLPVGCPECGHALLDLSYTTDRPRVRDARLLWGGVLAGALGLGVFVTQLAAPGVFFGAIPRAALIALAARDGDAFDRLSATAMSAGEERALLAKMIELEPWLGFRTSYAQDRWFESKIAGGALTPEQLDRVFSPLAGVGIEAPGLGRVGEGVVVRLGADKRPMRPTFGASPVYYFEGFVIGDDPTPVGGSVGDWRPGYLDDPTGEVEGKVPVYGWTPQRAGVVVVRARVVFAIWASGGSFTMSSPPTIDWSKAPESWFSVKPLWSSVVELEHAISVEQ